MKVPFLDLKEQTLSIKEELNNEVSKVLDSGKYLFGDEVKEFEKEFSSYTNSKHCVSVGSGTDALLLSLRALGIEKGDEVITSSFTAVPTVAAIALSGATPKFADINPETFLIDTEKIESLISKKTKAILPVHLYGQTCNMKEISEIAEKHSLSLIEDSCQSHGAEFNGKKSPIFSTACYSFFPTKNLSCFGDSGAVCTNDPELAEKVSVLRHHGQTDRKNYLHKYVSSNSRMDEIQASVLRVKLKHLDEWNEKRRAIAKQYSKEIENPKISLPLESPENKHVFHLYTVKCKERNSLQDFLEKKGIGTGIYYSLPVHKQEAFKYLKPSSLPVTEKTSKEILSIPMNPFISEEQINYVINALNEF